MVIYIFGITEWKSFEIIGEGSCLMKDWMECTEKGCTQTLEKVFSKLKFPPSPFIRYVIFLTIKSYCL